MAASSPTAEYVTWAPIAVSVVDPEVTLMVASAGVATADTVAWTEPSAVITSVCVLTVDPSVHVVVAAPSDPVVAVAGLALPPSDAVNVTDAPEKAAPSVPVTITLTLIGNVLLAGPVCPDPSCTDIADAVGSVGVFGFTEFPGSQDSSVAIRTGSNRRR